MERVVEDKQAEVPIVLSRRAEPRGAQPIAVKAKADGNRPSVVEKRLGPTHWPYEAGRFPSRAAYGGAAKKKGGTEELHSRSGRVGFTRPCRLAALSGRRAAQDGCGRALGGPERAGMEGLGEVLSAGRAAAPGQLQVEILGRGRSADRVAYVLAERAKPGGSRGHGEAARASARARRFQAMARAVFSVVAAVGLFVGPAAAENFLKPGDTGQLQFQVQHLTESGGDIEDLTVTVNAPAHFVVKGTSILGPLNAAAGETKTFAVDYEIAADAPEGAFTVGLHGVSSSEDMDPETVATEVLFTTKPVPFSLDRLG